VARLFTYKTRRIHLFIAFFKKVVKLAAMNNGLGTTKTPSRWVGSAGYALIYLVLPGIIAVGQAPLLAFVGLWVVTLVLWRRIPWPGIARLSRHPDIGRIIRRGGWVFVALTLTVTHEARFAFPLQLPERYLVVMLFYPLLSVVPQEVFFRLLWPRVVPTYSPIITLVLSALAFGWAHCVFLNPVAVGLSFLGGLLLADTWKKTRNWGLVCVEHTLYGWAVFTSGWGIYFYHGALQGMPKLFS
jgi:hypothetical protein